MSLAIKEDPMKPKRFFTRLLTRLVMFAALMIVVLALIESPVLTNEIGLGQMENSNAAFMMLGMYFSIRNILIAVVWLVVFLYACSIIRDTYKFIKSIYKEKN